MFDSMLLLMEAWLPPSDTDQKRVGRFQWQVKDPIPFVKMQPLLLVCIIILSLRFLMW